MKLYNTLSESVDDINFGDQVKVYTCGISPYDTTHLGHAFTYFISDVLIRFLERIFLSSSASAVSKPAKAIATLDTSSW